jgi:modification methylase
VVQLLCLLRKLGRNSIGYEINPAFVPLIKNKIGQDDILSSVRVDVINQSKIQEDFNERIKRLPYQFVDTHKLDKKIDIKKIQYGSKIDANSSGKREEYFSVKEVISPELIKLNNDLVIRLIGIKQNISVNGKANEYLINKVRGKKVFLKYDHQKHDEQNNTFINAHLLKEKLVIVDNSIDFKYKTKFNELQNG